MEFSDSCHLRNTDYWTSEEGAISGRAWLTARKGIWHVLIPDNNHSIQPAYAVAIPLLARDEPAGWQWGLWLNPKQSVRISLAYILGNPPPLPVKGARLDRMLMIYGHFLPGITDRVTHSFGVFEKGFVPVRHQGPLSIIRPLRKPDGTWDMHSHLT